MSLNKPPIFDPLLRCLQTICELEHIPFSESTAKTGLSIDSILTPRLFSKTAENLGILAKFESMPIQKLAQSGCPKILILNQNDACVLLRINKKEAEIAIGKTGTCKVIPNKTLKKSYTGYAISININVSFEKRSQDFNSADTKSWFWGAIWRYKNYYVHVMLASLISNAFVLGSVVK